MHLPIRNSLPNMVMIGGNSRNAGKTTLACKIIANLASDHEVIALKVTSIRPGEDDLHGSHEKEAFSGYSIIAETNTDSDKDTSLMLKAGAKNVFYIRASDDYVVEAMAQFIGMCNRNQPIICESRSLRKIINPGLFLMMMRLPEQRKDKNVTFFLEKADKVFIFGMETAEINQFATSLKFENGKFI